MISLIVCHRNPSLFQAFKNSLVETIGVPYELIVIDNSQGKYGICEAYNQGGHQAIYPILLFVHEDVTFHTMNWGVKLLSHFEDAKVGAVGLAGCQFFGKNGFSYGGKLGIGRMHIIQHFVNAPPKELLVNPDNELRTRVVCLDGVFIAARKSAWEKTPFDQVNLRAFHCYDLDFSLQISLNYKVYVVFDILLEHFSAGNYNQIFLEQFEIFNNKWQSKLPIYTPEFKLKKIPIGEWQMFLASFMFYPRNIKVSFQLFFKSVKLFLQYPRLKFFLRGTYLLLKRLLIQPKPSSK
jgi:hypothetical protein